MAASRDTATLLLFVEQAGQCLGRCQSPGGFQGAAQGRLSDSFQAHVGAASASPCAGTWIENARLSFDEHFLLDGCEFEHATIFFGITERGEELSGDAKVRMVHVRLLRRFREAKGKTAEVVGGHLVASADTEFYTNEPGESGIRSSFDVSAQATKREKTAACARRSIGVAGGRLRSEWARRRREWELS